MSTNFSPEVCRIIEDRDFREVEKLILQNKELRFSVEDLCKEIERLKKDKAEVAKEWNDALRLVESMRNVVEAAVAYEVNQETWDRLSKAVDEYKAQHPEKRAAGAEDPKKYAHLYGMQGSTGQAFQFPPTEKRAPENRNDITKPTIMPVKPTPYSDKRICEAEVFGEPDKECGESLPCRWHKDGKCKDCGEPMHYGGVPGKDCGMPWPG